MSFEAKNTHTERNSLICAWCKNKIGEIEAEGDSHGICPECRKKLEREAGIESSGQKSDIQHKIDEMQREANRDFSLEIIPLLEHNIFPGKYLKLKSHGGFIKKETGISVDENTTETQFLEIAKKLREKYGI